jgi:putative Mg2+ transporter-C (MgtC) family protein
MLPHTQLILRIALGAALGGVIGYERDRHGRPVGLRTHLIVALTAATFMVLSTQFVYMQNYGRDDLVEVDASRIAASVVSAVGFLAGGAILRTGPSVQGLTTAAGLWLVTAIGMTSGAGMFVESSIVTLIGLGALTVLRRFEDKEDDVIRRRVSVSLRRGSMSIEHIATALGEVCLEVVALEYENRLGEEGITVASFDVRIVGQIGVSRVIQTLESLPGIERVKVQAVA